MHSHGLQQVLNGCLKSPLEYQKTHLTYKVESPEVEGTETHLPDSSEWEQLKLRLAFGIVG